MGEGFPHWRTGAGQPGLGRLAPEARSVWGRRNHQTGSPNGATNRSRQAEPSDGGGGFGPVGAGVFAQRVRQRDKVQIQRIREAGHRHAERGAGEAAGDAPRDQRGYEDGAVAITDLGPEVADGTAEKVAEVEAALKDGSLHVFDTSKFTVDGAEVTTAPIDLTYYDFSTGSPVAVYQGETKEAISDGYFHEGELRAAPTFSLRIDGIIEDADPVA